MNTLKHPIAKTLLKRLKHLLSVASQTFRVEKGQEARWKPELFEIPQLVARLQEYIGRKKAVRVPFWRCVLALNEADSTLRLVATLDALVRRATSRPAGPLTRLREQARTGNLTQSVREFAKLDRHFRKRLNERPKHCSSYRRMTEAAATRELQQIVAKVKAVAMSRAVDQLISYACYLELYWQHRRWVDEYLEDLESLNLFLLELQCDGYFRQFGRLVAGKFPTSLRLTEGQKRRTARDRQRNRRFHLA